MLNQNNMPGAGSINETLEFMRNMWGSMGAPAMGIPSLSVEEINKKISDLKTVASWLELNMNMLRATIQTMEVQSATLSTLQAMGAILTPREAQSGAADATADRAATASGFANWPEPSFKPAPAEAVADAGEGTPEQTDAARTAEPQAAAVPDFQATMTNPNAWWNLLQEQFQQAVGNVLAEQQPAVAKASPAAAKATAKSARAAQAPAPAPKKTTKAKPAAKAGTRAKSAVVQSAPSKSVSRKPKSP